MIVITHKCSGMYHT